MHYRERRCPHCGRTNGLYSKYTYRNVKGIYDFNGEFIEENFDSATYEGGKNLYCLVCGKFVCKAKDYANIYKKIKTTAV